MTSSPRHTLGALVSLLLASALPLSAQTADSPRHQSLLHVAAYTAGGVLIGAWAGYMASQVARSDWSDPTGRSAARLTFTVSGATLGSVAGALLGTRGGRRSPGAVPAVKRPLVDGPLTEGEIEASNTSTIRELLRQVRPQWLRWRGAEAVATHAEEEHAGGGGVRVYLNGNLLGGITTLDDISIYSVTEIRFVDGPSAVMRWGTGNEDGAILLTTRASS